MQLPPLILKEVREAPNPQEEESPDKQRQYTTATNGLRVTPTAKRRIVFPAGRGADKHQLEANYIERRSGSVTKNRRIGNITTEVDDCSVEVGAV